MYRAFPRQLYGPRAKIETVFSVIKRKLSTKAPGCISPIQMRQALLLGLAFNLYRLRHPTTPAGCKQSRFKFNILKVVHSREFAGVFLEVRIPKELANWQTELSEQFKVKDPHTNQRPLSSAFLHQALPLRLIHSNKSRFTSGIPDANRKLKIQS